MIKRKVNTTEQGKQGVTYSENIQIPIRTGKNNNALIVGVNDAEMQKRFIEPNLLQANDSYVIAGIPEVSVLRMQDKMIENGCYIQILDLDGYMSTAQYDPLKHINAEEDAKKIVDCIINNTLDNCHLDSLELQLEKTLLISLILYLVEIADESVRNLNTILWMLKLAYVLPASVMARPSQYTYCCNNGFDVNNHLDELFDGQRKIVQTITICDDVTNQKYLDCKDINNNNEESKLQDILCNSLCLRQYQLFKCSDIKTQKKVITDAIMRFSLFTDIYKYERGEISYQKSNTNGELDIQSLRQPKSCLLITYSKASEATKVLTAILISQIYDSLIRESQGAHVKFIVDGIDNACLIPEFKHKLTSCQNFNISFDVLLPSITFAEEIYDDWNYISQAFSVYVCFDAIDEHTAEYFRQKIKKNMKNKYAFQKNKYPVACIQKILDKDEIMMLPDYACLVIVSKAGQYIDAKKWR